MAYQNGTATSPVDLLQKLVAFAKGAGWTANGSEAVNAHWKAHLSNGSVCANLFANIGVTTGYYPWGYTPATPAWNAAAGCVHLYCSDGYDGGAAWNAQPGRPLAGSATAGAIAPLAASATMAYWFFGTGDYIHCNVMLSNGAEANFGWGTLEKAGAYTGGAYFWGCDHPQHYGTFVNAVTGIARCPMSDGSSSTSSTSMIPAGYIRVDYPGNTGLWASGVGITSGNTMTAAKYVSIHTSNSYIPSTDAMKTFQVSSATQQATLLPLHQFLRLSTSPHTYSLLGKVPDLYSLQSSYTSGTEIEIGADTYVAFSSSTASYPGWAAKKVA